MKKLWRGTVAQAIRGVTLCACVVSASNAEVLFEESFDDQPDWHSGLEENNLGYPSGQPDTWQSVERGHKLPNGWESVRQSPRWAPSTGHPDRHENIEIVERNAGKARGGNGKSMVVWRDSGGKEWQWNSDGILSKKLDQGYESLYVKFWIKLSPEWTPFGESGMTKFFRVSSFDGTGNLYKAFSEGTNSAILLWDYEANNYGARNKLSFRGDPQETNYKVKNPEPIETPRTFLNGFMSLNFTGNVVDLDGDGTNEQTITDLINLESGEPIDPNNGIVEHAELWGDQWHKVEFYVKMNSEPGAMDGVVKQWFDGQLVFSNEKFPWMGHESEGGILWNVVHFGGNSHFHAYPDSERREEWYSIDDITIRTDMPADAGESVDQGAPKPPTEFSVQ